VIYPRCGRREGGSAEVAPVEGDNGQARASTVWAGTEAGAIGWGGVAAVARATGMAISTVRKGRDEARAVASPDDVVKVRRSAGKRPYEVAHPCRSMSATARPAPSYETVINLIGNTTHRGGLVVRSRFDRRRYPTGKKIFKKELRELKIERDEFHGDWNYVIRPRGKPRWPVGFAVPGALAASAPAGM
jgi:Rhodopirellula transposase DDE domain